MNCTLKCVGVQMMAEGMGYSPFGASKNRQVEIKPPPIVPLRNITPGKFLYDQLNFSSITACGHRIAHRKWKEIKLQLGQATGWAAA